METIMSENVLLEKYQSFPPEMQLAITAYIELLEKKYTDLKENFVEKKRKFGLMKNGIKYMAPDFDEPLDDLKDYM